MLRIQRILLYLFCFSVNFEVWDPFGTNGFFSIAKLTGILYFLAFIPSFIKHKTATEVKPVLKSIWVYFGLLLLVNALHTASITEHFFDFTIFQNILLFWVLINHAQSEDMVLEKGLLFFAFGSITLTLLYYAGIGISYDEGRVTVFGDNENIIGLRTCISIIIILLAVMQNRLQMGKIRFLLLLPIPFMIALLVGTGSRTAIISFAIVYITGLVLYKTKKYWWKLVLLVAGGVTIFFMWQYATQNEVLMNRLLLSIYEGNLSGREVIWQNIIPLIKNNPIFGIGQSGYAKFCQITYGVYTSPHNVILEILVFTGFTGLFIYFYFLYQLFKRSYVVYKYHGFLLPILLMLITGAMIVVSHILEIKIGWIIFAYIATTSITQEEVNPEEDQNFIHTPLQAN